MRWAGMCSSTAICAVMLRPLTCRPLFAGCCRPGYEVLMTDKNARRAGQQVRVAPTPPSRDARILGGRNFKRRADPPFDQLPLERLLVGFDQPIAGRCP